MMSSTNKSDVGWVPYFFGQIHSARAMALVDLGLQQQLSEIDQAIGRFRDSQRQMPNSSTAIAVLMKTFLAKGIIIHQTTPSMKWVDDPDSLLQKRLNIADKTFAEAAEQLQQLPKARSPSLDALASRLEGMLIYRQWMIDAHRRTKSGMTTVAIGDEAELAELKKASDKYAAAEAKAPGSAIDLMDGATSCARAGSSTTRSSDTGAPSTSIRRTQTRHSTSSSPTSTASNAMPGRPTPATCWWRWAHSRTIWPGGPTAARTTRCFPGCSSCLPVSVTARPSRNA